MNRAQFLASGVGIALRPAILASIEIPWERGCLEIHHIATGRGNATLIIGPDATTILIDAGAAHSPSRYMAPALPNATRSPGEWIGRYVRHATLRARRNALDYFIATHYHDDHLGGLADVLREIAVRRFIDRGDEYEASATPEVLRAYRALTAGRIREPFRVGENRQVVLQRAPSDFPTFEIRNLAANGNVWNGSSGFVARFPKGGVPNENICSIALRIRYGAFSYYTGGDLTYITEDGTRDWHDIETPVAQICGKVDVAQINHHGYYDAAGPQFLSALDPKACIIPSWHVTQPDLAVLDRLLHSRARDVYALGIASANRIVNERLIGRLKSTNRHVIVRAWPDGHYRIETRNPG